MLTDIALVSAGLVLLFVGGEGLVRGSVSLADRLGLSKLIIGLVIVGFGTSTPELLVSVKAALDGVPEIALGNVIGSNTANILLIVGISIVIRPIAGWNRTAVRDAVVATLVGLGLLALLYGEKIGRQEGVVLIIILLAYLSVSYWLERRAQNSKMYDHEAEEFEDVPVKKTWVALLFVIGGIAILVFGADLLVKGAVSIAEKFGVPDAVIGLSLVAVGTSLPELATSIVAAIRRHSDVVLGNVIGSNIFNILAILGLTATIAPVDVSARFREVDTPVMLAASVLLVLLLFVLNNIGRVWGVAMMAAYAGYIVYLFTSGMAT